MKLNKVFWVLGFSFFYLACSPEPQSVATINGTSIKLPYFQSRYSEFLSLTKVDDNLKYRFLFLESLIDEELILDNAESDQDFMARQAPHLKKAYDQVLLNKLYETQLKDHLAPTDPQLRELYTWSKMKLHVRHLFARDFETIQEIQGALERGDDWKMLARIHFKDPVLSANGGDLGEVKLGDLDPDFEKIAFTLSDGEISDPVQTENGYSIIQVLGRDYDPFLTEQDFKTQKGWLNVIGMSHNKRPMVKTFTDSIASALDIRVIDEGMSLLLTQVPEILFTGEPRIENGDAPCLSYGLEQKRMPVSEAVLLLSSLSHDQKNRIDNVQALENTLRGLLVRGELLTQAETLGLKKSPSTIEAFNDFRRNHTIRQSMNSLFEQSAPENSDLAGAKKQVYFEFRDALREKAHIAIDTMTVTGFTLNSTHSNQTNEVRS